MSRAELDEHLRRHALTLADETEQDVFGTDVVVSELERFAKAQLEDLLGTRSEGNVPRGRLLTLADDLFDLAAHTFEGDTQRLERLRRHTLTLVDEAEEDVLRADVVVVEHPGLFLSQDNDAPRAIGEPFEHRTPSHSPAAGPVRRSSRTLLPLLSSGTRVVRRNLSEVPSSHSTL